MHSPLPEPRQSGPNHAYIYGHPNFNRPFATLSPEPSRTTLDSAPSSEAPLTPAAAIKREKRKLDRLRKKERKETERDRKALYRESEVQSETETQSTVGEEEEKTIEDDIDSAVPSESDTTSKENVEVCLSLTNHSRDVSLPPHPFC